MIPVTHHEKKKGGDVLPPQEIVLTPKDIQTAVRLPQTADRSKTHSPSSNLTVNSQPNRSQPKPDGNPKNQNEILRTIDEKGRIQPITKSTPIPMEGPRPIQNEGNTCYVSASLQALKNSLDFSGQKDLGPIGKILQYFYQGKEQSVIDRLENALNQDLRMQSDAAAFISQLCEILIKEGSGQLLDNIKFNSGHIDWKCKNCNAPDQRSTNNFACFLLLTDCPGDFNNSLHNSLYYEREKKMQ